MEGRDDFLKHLRSGVDLMSHGRYKEVLNNSIILLKF
jgi:hypothetical protein